MNRMIRAALAVAVLLAAGTAPSAAAEKPPVLGSADFTGEFSHNAERGEIEASVEVNTLKRPKDGRLVNLMYTIHNEDKEEFYPVSALSSSSVYDYGPIKSKSGAVLDAGGTTRYHTLTDEQFYCFCSNANGFATTDVLDPGTSGVLWASFLVPEDVERVTVRIPAFGPVEDVPIG
ncbi:hypothetical protein CLV63_10289 [Murinocardiopsis flavida]|uniref:DUF4352 domain-containing protein n=1 Tax=Murinocardiopsis flavida TaxID=645275 RepID=A0A2P8DRW8_9ACTN|nr:hypothetical protein [Murinocardiopsis flavida]PSK99962.1 hypothetical protein CLV63_10289 [Murinocardiopsis flavida]